MGGSLRLRHARSEAATSGREPQGPASFVKVATLNCHHGCLETLLGSAWMRGSRTQSSENHFPPQVDPGRSRSASQEVRAPVVRSQVWVHHLPMVLIIYRQEAQLQLVGLHDHLQHPGLSETLDCRP